MGGGDEEGPGNGLGRTDKQNYQLVSSPQQPTAPTRQLALGYSKRSSTGPAYYPATRGKPPEYRDTRARIQGHMARPALDSASPFM